MSPIERFLQKSLKHFHHLQQQLELQFSNSANFCQVPVTPIAKKLFLHLFLFHFFQQHPSFPKNGYYDSLRKLAPELVWKTVLFWIYPTFRNTVRKEVNFSPAVEFCFLEILDEKIEDELFQNIAHLPATLLMNSTQNKEGFFDQLSQENFSQDEREHPEKITPFLFSLLLERLRQSSEKKSKGVFYTPPELVRYMCQQSLLAYLKNFLPEMAEDENIWLPHETRSFFLKKYAKPIDDLLATIRICDLAVGAGAFPLGILNEIVCLREKLMPYLSTTNAQRTRFILKKHTIQHSLYGADIDSEALEIFQWRLWFSLQTEEKSLRIPFLQLDYYFFSENPLTSLRPEKLNLETNIAVYETQKKAYIFATGEIQKKQLQEQIFDSRQQIYTTLFLSKKTSFNLFIDYAEVFQGASGFDIVLGNPPYLKEREHMTLLQATKQSEFGQKYHQGKMDFWFYFLHQAIDITHDSGVIALITPSYWLQSHGARKLRERIQASLYFDSVLDLGKSKVFQNVSGHHMVAIYSKKKQTDLFPYYQIQSLLPPLEVIRKSELKNSEVFVANHEIALHSFLPSVEKTIPLGSICHISQGVIEAPHKITAKHIKEVPSATLKIGEGVFVLSREEFEALQLTEEEKQICVPYVTPNEVARYVLCPEKEQFLIYANQENKKKIAYDPSFMRLKQHLEQYLPFITSVNAPYGLHRPRNKAYFQRPKLIFRNMFIENTCAYDEEAYFVGFSLSILSAKNPQYSLKYILALLHSSYAQKWFYAYGKRRGAGVDIGIEKLRSFPVKILPLEQQEPLIKMVEQIILLKKDPKKQEESLSLEKVLEDFF